MITPENKHPDYDLLAKYFAGETTNAESERVETWMGESDANWEEFQRLNQLWEETKLGETAEFDSKKAWGQVEPQLAERNPTPNWTSYGLRIAAILAGIVVISLLYRNFLGQQDAVPMVANAIDKPEEVRLNDGSAIHLNTGSSIEYPETFADNHRTVVLDGEAFFDVARDTTSAFIIHVEDAVIEVLGTSFNVSSQEGSVTVSVVTGKVELRMKRDASVKRILTAGEQATLDPDMKMIDEIAAPAADYLFWKNRTLNYQDVPLSNVVNQLNLHYGSNISIEDSTAFNCLLSSRFEDMEVTEIVEVITATFDLEIEETEDQLILKGEGCNR